MSPSRYPSDAPEVVDLTFGYCTNVHAGTGLAEAKANLDRIATRVKETVAPGGRLPVGLWLAQNAAQQLQSAHEIPRFGEWLHGKGLKAYTFNGFPQGDFHQPVVKHAVYEPTWLDDERVHYTSQLADILVQLLDDTHGSISTLPLGWPHQVWQADALNQAGQNLRMVADHLHRLLESTGKEIILAIEPEPGCVLDTAVDMVNFLQAHVYDNARPHIRRHIGVCHDICHSAVMFEPQSVALMHYLNNGVRIGKVQVSSAVEVPWQSGPGTDQLNHQTWTQLQAFSEPRYLHQTTRQLTAQPGSARDIDMVDDLPQALQTWLGQAPADWPTEPWRIHFHVPIFVERFGQLLATRGDIHQATAILEAHRQATVEGATWFSGDYEVETYAWGVLPPELQADNLADGIAQELTYFQQVLKGSRS